MHADNPQLNKSSGSGRYVFIDAIRALSFAAIIVYHFMAELPIMGIYDFNARGIFYSNANMHIATLAVALFFMISGAGNMLGSGGKRGFKVGEYYFKRALRILIPFYIAWWISFGVNLITYKGLDFIYMRNLPKWRIIFTFAGMDEYVEMLGLPAFRMGVGEWFLGCLIIMYILFPAVRTVLLKYRFAAIGVFTAVYLYIVLNYHYIVPPHMNFFLKLYEFILGVFLIRELRLLKPWMAVVCVPVIIAYLTCRSDFGISDGLDITILALSVFVSAALCEPVLSRCRSLAGLLGVLNRYSYEAFLVHHIVIYFFGRRLACHIISTPQMLALFALEMLITAVLAVLVHHVAEPIISAIKRFTETFAGKQEHAGTSS